MKQQNNNMITASIVTYRNTLDEINILAISLLHNAIDILYIIDNSPDETLSSITNLSNKIEYIPNTNTGYGRAHNIAIKKAIDSRAQYHIIVNPDIRIISMDAINRLEIYMNHHLDVGLVMPNIIYPNGGQQYLCKLLPTPFDLLIRRFLPQQMCEKRRQQFELRFTGYNKEMDVPFLSGCFMFLRVDALREIGLFDERFFMYGEDIDLSRRIHARFRTVFYPEVTIIHAHEAASYKNKKMLLIHIRNIIRYFNKWGWFFDRERKHINHATLCKLRQNN